MELLEHLRKRESEGNPIRVGIVGCGQMGSGMVHVSHRMPGLRIVALADLDPERPRRTLAALQIPPERITITNRRSEAQQALRAGRYLVTEDGELLAQLDALDAVVEATGSTEAGARVAWGCIQHRKHVIMLNVETDVTVGVLLQHEARKRGCVYTAASGDEPGACKALYDFACALGFEVVCVGKGKNNRIDFHADPDSAREEALRKNMNPKMLAAFQDGTKTMVEMAAVANATGLVPDVPGMHGLAVDREELHRVYVPKADGGVLEHRGCVEYSTGRVAPGVFVICTSADARIREDMKFVSMGDGPYYQLYRPYHLCNIETPISVAEAVIYGEATLAPKRMVAEVLAVAKRDLKAGERIGDIGGPEVYHRIYRYEEALSLNGIPMGLATGGRLLKDVPRDSLLTADSIALDTTRMAWRLRQEQDRLLARECRRPASVGG